MQAAAGVTEALGSEIHVLFSLDAPPVEHASITEAAADDREDAAIPLTGGKMLWTARVAARSKIVTGQPVELAIDTSNLQFFDPVSGLSIGRISAS
jgi:multiple sugar transport system ATP-binding protein